MADYSYEKFKELLDEKNVSTYKVAKDLDIAQATFSSWKNGKYTPKTEKMQKIADYFEVPVTYFYKNALPQDFKDRVDAYMHEVAAGQGRTSPPPEKMPKEEGDFAKVVGDSMLPTLHNGDVVRIVETTSVEPKDIALVRINGDELTLKHIEVTADGLWVRGENKDAFKDRFFTMQEVITLPVQVVGQAVELVSRKL